MSGGVIPEGYRVYPPEVNMYRETVLRAIGAGCDNTPALLWPGGRMTYRDLDIEVGRVAAGLRAAGLSRGDALLLRSNNTVAYVAMILAAFRLGAVAVLTSGLLTKDEIAYIRENCDARIAAAPAHLLAPLFALKREGALEAVVAMGGEEGSDALTYASLGAGLDPPDLVQTGAMEPAFMVYSSGTTGRPKGILHAHRWGIALGDPVVLHNEYTPGDITMTPGEFSFMGTFGNNLIGPLRAGATIALFGERATPRSVLEAVARHRVTKFLSVPTLYRRMLSEAGVEDGLDLSCVQYFISAGESLGSTVPEAWSKRFSFPLYEIYGVSEVMTCMANTAYNPVKWGSMGKGLPGIRMEIMNDRLEPVPAGASGRLMIHRSDPGMFLTYHKQWEKWQKAHKGDWYDTGDVMMRDEEGYYFYLGRKDDLFKSRGYFISPQEIENALLRHPAVAEAAVIGVPDETYGNRIEAFARLTPDTDPPDPVEVLQQVAETLAPYKVPRSLTFVEDIPKNAVGKIMRRALTG